MLIKSGSAKQIAEETPSRAATIRKIFLKAKGVMLIKIILSMVIISSGRARAGHRIAWVLRFPEIRGR